MSELWASPLHLLQQRSQALLTKSREKVGRSGGTELEASTVSFPQPLILQEGHCHLRDSWHCPLLLAMGSRLGLDVERQSVNP